MMKPATSFLTVLAVCAGVALFVMNMPTVNALVRRLQDDPALRDACGFGDELPSPGIATFQRMFSSSLHSVGGFPPRAAPVPVGPRQLAQPASIVAIDDHIAGTLERVYG